MDNFSPISFAAGLVLGPIIVFYGLRLLGWLISKSPDFIER
jgi:hypothetical protein